MGFLNIGPAYGIALFSVLEPLMNHMWGLKSIFKMPEEAGLPYGLHPIGVLHMVIAEQCMKKFASRNSEKVFDDWAKIFQELANIEKGVRNLVILSKENRNSEKFSEKLIIPRNRMANSVKDIVDIIVDWKLECLENSSIADYYYCWNSLDEQQTCDVVTMLLKRSLNIPEILQNDKIRARHIVAATTIASAKSTKLEEIKWMNEEAINILAKIPTRPLKAKPIRKKQYIIPYVELTKKSPKFSRVRGYRTLRTF
jgi:hypothetical protein